MGTTTEKDRLKANLYNEEEMVETEEYFQNISSTSQDKQCSSSLKPNNKQTNDYVTIGVLPSEKDRAEFDAVLLEAIDETLSSLGEPVKNTVYQHLRNDFGIEKKSIPSQINKFWDILHRIFGLSANRLEIKVMEKLNAKIKVNVKWPEYEWPLSKWVIADMSFTEYVHNARKNYVAKCQEKR